MSPADGHRVVVLLTCFNRREETVRCLRTLRRALGEAGSRGQSVVVSLCDDGSRDGTAEAALEAYPGLVLTRGNGSLFWAGGMRTAAAAVADEIARADRVLFVNDDVVLEDDAVDRLEQRLADGADIAVGQVSDPDTGARTYGALASDPRRPLRLRPTEVDADIAAFNGNVVLFTGDAYRRLGGLDPAYTHGIADYDIAMRARRIGLRMAVSDDFVGTCLVNLGARTWLARSTPLSKRVRIVLSPKGLPPREWLRFTRRFGGTWWPVDFASPYVRAVLGRAPGHHADGEG